MGESMHIGGLKTILVKEGHEQEFETLFREMRAAIAHGEPDCLYYSLMKSRTTARAYIVEEQYRDQAAFDAHQASAYGKVYFPKIRAILERIDVEYFDVVEP
jgi:quinol monooxygenase YgiN